MYLWLEVAFNFGGPLAGTSVAVFIAWLSLEGCCSKEEDRDSMHEHCITDYPGDVILVPQITSVLISYPAPFSFLLAICFKLIQ